MSYLIDTNILLRCADTQHPMYQTAINGINKLKENDEEMYIIPQNLIEFWNVATRPKERNGLGYSLARTQREVIQIKNLFPIILDSPPILSEWERLVTTYEVKGVNVHDARLVAVMLVNHLSHILTFNDKDFRRYNSEITVINPNSILQ